MMMALAGLMASLVMVGAIVALWVQRPLRATGGTLTAFIGMAGLLAITPIDPIVAGLWLLIGGGGLGSVAWVNASTLQRAEEERGRRRTRWYKAALLLPLVAWLPILIRAWQQASPLQLTPSTELFAPAAVWPLVPGIVVAALVPLWWARVHAAETP